MHRRLAVLWPPRPQRGRWPSVVLARNVDHVLRVLAQSRLAPPFVPLLVGLDLRFARSSLCVGWPTLVKLHVDAQDLARRATPSCNERALVLRSA